ncbi:MAG: glutamate--tRNA ligase [Thermodesulfobacteriota bacterium]
MTEVRVRFPPSPTGYLHIGGARTAIYNWLFARRHGGKFILRIEDTDAERSTSDSITGIIEGLTWLGIDWDEGPYFQSEFAREHVAAAGRLLETGHAYKCFCTKEELEAKREAARDCKGDYRYDRTCRQLSPTETAAREAAGVPYVIRFKVPDAAGGVSFDDQVYGTVTRAYGDIEDFVIVRSNGEPLYLLCNVVDDIRDRISHVIRGQDGLVNTPRQILLYHALGAPLPVFAHMPLTLDHNKAKISKRKHGEVVAVQFYRDHGFLPWALANFLVLLGWSTSDNREIFSREELIQIFSLDRINRTNSVFNYRADDPKFFTDPKALAINAHYLRTMAIDELAPLVEKELKKANIWQEGYREGGELRDWFLATIDLIRSRFHVLTDFATAGRAYFDDVFEIEEKAWNKNMAKFPELKELLPELADRIEALTDFGALAIEETLKGFAEEKGVKPGVPINGLRTVVTGQLAGPGIYDIIRTIGRERVAWRLRQSPKLFT